MPAEVLAVEPDVAVHVDAVELDPDAAVFRFRRRGERLAVPADAAVEISAAVARRGERIEGAFDAPVVRHVELPPGRVVEIGVLAVFDLAQMEPPIAVEIDGRAVACRCGGWLAASGEEKCQTAYRGGSCRVHASAFQVGASSGIGYVTGIPAKSTSPDPSSLRFRSSRCCEQLFPTRDVEQCADHACQAFRVGNAAERGLDCGARHVEPPLAQLN